MSSFIKKWSTGYDFNGGNALLIGYNNYIYFPSVANIIQINLNGTINNNSWAGGLTDAQAIVIDGQNMYVSNYQDTKIMKINFNQAPFTVSTFRSLSYCPMGLAIYNGYLYVCNYSNHSINKISLTNPSDDMDNWVQSNISSPTSISINSNYMYVCNSDIITRILLSDPTNNIEFIPASLISGPIGLAIYNGYIYVSNFNSGKISKFNLNDPTNNNDLNWLIGLDNPDGLTIYNDNMYISNYADGLPLTYISKVNMLSYPSPACLLKGTKVKTINGYKKIEDINVGDYVISDKRVPKRVIKVHNWNIKWTTNAFEKNKIYVIENHKTKTYISGFHKFMKDNKMIFAFDGKLRVARKEEICDENDEYKLYHIQIEDHIDHHLLVNGDNIVESWNG